MTDRVIFRARLAALVAAACIVSPAGFAKEPKARDLGKLLHRDDFDANMSQWVVEQMPGGTARLKDGALEIEDAKGCTVWFRKKLTSPVRIRYEVTIVKKGGKYDRGSDLNCFWMAIDPKRPNALLARSKARGGRFANYHSLRLYYVGYGANGNKTTRFRRYPGDGTRPLLPKHDLKDRKHMLAMNRKMRIEIVCAGDRTQYLRDGKVVFDFRDPKPYRQGWFGFRTVRNHMRIDNFRVYRPAAKKQAATRPAGKQGP
jgi:hypothetical protein